MHILHILTSGLPVPAINGGAVQQTVQELSQACVKYGHKVTIISAALEKDKEKLQKISDKNIQYCYVYYRKLSLLNLPMFILHFYNKIIKNGPYNVIHVHTPFVAFLCKLINNKIGSPKIIWHVHNRSRLAFLLKYMSIDIVGVSNSVIEDIKTILPKCNFSVIPNICRHNLFPLYTKESKEQAKEYFNLPHDKKIIAFVGRISPEKGLHVLLKAFDKFSNDDKSRIILLIAGSSWFKGSPKTEYEKHLIKKSNKLDVRWLGYIDNWQLYKVYHACDLLVVPSLWEEPAGQVILEAQSCGTSIIASNVGGIPEYLSPYEKVVSPNCPNQLAKEILDVINRNHDYSLAKKRSDWVKNRFSMDKIAKLWIGVYKE